MRTYVLSLHDETRVQARAVQVGAEQRHRHAIQVVAQPVHGLRPPLHLLLRPTVGFYPAWLQHWSTNHSRETSPTYTGDSTTLRLLNQLGQRERGTRWRTESC